MPRRTDRSARPGSLRAFGWVARGLTLGLVLLAIAAGAAGAAVAQVPPDARWRTLDTRHFRVNFTVGLDSLAERTAARAEWAYELLARELVDPPRGRIDIVLTDAVDFANGSATPFPTNRIVLYAHPPTDVAELAFTTDWLELLVLHELVHIFHLDEAGGVWQALRSVLGRNALLFPHAYSPSWLIEGLATYYESSLTPGGRVRGTLFEMALRTAVLEEEFFSIDRASGEPRSWPAGSTRYIYGALFLDFLARHGGPEAMTEFVERYGSQTIPYLLNRAARGAFEASFTAAWRDWSDSLRTRYSTMAESIAARGLTELEILTGAGRDAYFPRYAPDGERIAYSAAPGDDQPAIRVIGRDGSQREVVPRSILGSLDWTADGKLLYADVAFRGPYRIYSDLWAAGTEGDRRRLTRGARLDAPDLHPDGRTLVAVRSGGGSTVLVVGDPADGELRPITDESLDVQWAQPRWSPSGDAIAAVRWSPGGLHDIVLLDRTGRVLREITRDRAVDASPAWTPDGRHLLFGSDRSGIPNLYAYDVAADRLFQVTNVLSGAFHPDVSPDGEWIAFSYYQADGYHIARMPFDPFGWRAAPPPRPAAQPLLDLRSHAPVETRYRPYSPWPSVAPAAWTLTIAGGTDLGGGAGIAASGVDVVRRHLWAAEALAYFDGGQVDAGAVYRYRGLGNPVVELSASQEWSVACGQGSLACGGGEPLASALLRRDREAELSLMWVRQRMRSTAWFRPSVGAEKRDLTWQDPGAAPDVGIRQTPTDLAARLEVGRSSVRGFALSVGPQAGFSLVAAAEGHRYTQAIGTDAEPAGYLRLLGRTRGYRTVRIGGSAHVLALRGDMGLEFGSRSPGFEVGGASGGALPLAVDLDVFGGGVGFPIRGYPEGAQFGNRAAAVSAEYRFPLLRVERGLGLIPAYLDRFTGDVFLDAGTAWCAASCPARLAAAPGEPRILSSVGAELVTELRFGFHTVIPLRVGAAVPLRNGRNPEIYLRVGRSF